jgi:hypothetical protein
MLEFYRDRVIAKDDDPVRKTAEAFGICEAEVVQIVNAELQALETRDIRDWRGDR